MEVLIEKFNKNQIDIASKIYLELFNSFGEKWTLSNSKKYLSEIYNSTYSYSAISNGKMIGFLCGVPVTTEEYSWLFIDAIVVNNEYQQHGIGKLLWEKAIADAKIAGISGVRLFANPKYSSYSWYKKMGLSESGWVEMKKLLTNNKS